MLEGTLRHVLSQDGPIEVIVADGGSSDRTVAIAADFHTIQFVQAHRGRASQMNAGATLATGEWLLFLHADTRLPEGGLPAIRQLTPDNTLEAGGFHHRFSGGDWRLRFVSWLDNWRCRKTSVMYGDQALFVRRSVFEELGGFPSVDALEDVIFCELLKRRRTPILLDFEVVTNARKFKQLGVWRSLARCALILTRYELGLPLSANDPFFQDVR